MKTFDLEEVVMKLVGPVDAVGKSEVDEQRLLNLRVLTELVDRLLAHIQDASRSANNYQDSMKKIGKYAEKFLNEVREA